MAKNVIWLYPKLEKWMGGTKYVFECSKRMSKEFPFTVIAQKGSREVVTTFKEEHIDVCVLDSPTFTDVSFWLNFKKTIANDAHRISNYIDSDTVILSSMYPLNYIAAKFPNRHIQIIYEPFSFFYRNDIYKDLGMMADLFFRFIRRIYSSTDKYATQTANVVLTLSQYESNNIKNIYGVHSHVIYEGVDTTLFYPRETIELAMKYPGRIPLMHSTGFDVYKGTDLIIEALPLLKERVPDFKLFITYTREDKRKLQSYYKFIKNNALEDQVEFLNYLPLDKLPYYYSFARVYIEPGKGRSMSLSNKEAMACGTPVIRGNDSSEEVIDGYNGLLVPPDNPYELVEAIHAIVSNDELRTTMSTNAIAFIKENFSWDSVVQHILKHV